MSLPPFSSLPVKKDGPPFNAWGLYGPDDELGRLNLIDAEAVQRGARAVKHGICVNLNNKLDVEPMNSSRARMKQEIVAKGHCNDDILTFNTQISTQWDGLRHYPYQDWPEKGQQVYYGGMTTEQAIDPKNLKCGTQNYVTRPISSQGHLLDIPRYLAANGLTPLSPLDDSTPITVEHLDGCIAYQGSVIQHGDVLLVRTGWQEAFYAVDAQDRLKIRNQGTGMKRGEETLRWHWEKGFAAVASDVRAYESFPHDNDGLSLHEVFLAGWGMPIGELFNLEELGIKCAELKQWSFLFTSMGLYVEGGIATPPNAQAIL